MSQQEMAFQISLDESAVFLHVNTKEQIFAEKLKSLLRLGTRSNRPKDVFDMFYLMTMLTGTSFAVS